ncbi:MAG: hypothetical protein EOM24_29510 [Chloroflexia bacterium]|nr:hypothetical protein [Chloroflexia bacterium]
MQVSVTTLAPLQPPPLATNPNHPLAWMSLRLNPGKSLLDSVLGATTGMLSSLASGVTHTA